MLAASLVLSTSPWSGADTHTSEKETYKDGARRLRRMLPPLQVVLLSLLCLFLVIVAALIVVTVWRRRRRAEGNQHVLRYPEFPALADTLFEP